MRGQRGFTLVELIMVIVLLGIVATISTQFVSFSTSGAIDLGDRQQRALQGVVISEQITREIREAFPLTVRSEQDECLEWMPILGGTSYRSLPFDEEQTTFSVIPFEEEARQAINKQEARLVVYGYGVSQDKLYNVGNVGPVSPEIDSINGSGDVVLVSPHRFTRRSPEKRIYAVGQPVSICQGTGADSSKLYRFTGYPPEEDQPSYSWLDNNADAGLMSANLYRSHLVDWKVTPVSLRRSAIVSFEFVLKAQNSDETTTVTQEVQIRNVP
jgi:MSHA biogenesis protein MshO